MGGRWREKREKKEREGRQVDKFDSALIIIWTNTQLPNNIIFLIARKVLILKNIFIFLNKFILATADSWVHFISSFDSRLWVCSGADVKSS